MNTTRPTWRASIATATACALVGCASPKPKAREPAKPAPEPAQATSPAKAPEAPLQPAQRPPEPPPPPKTEPVAGLREVFPFVRVDVAKRIVEFDGTVPIDCHDARTPRVYLEVTVCTPDTKEHETLVVTKARPSHIHAALLAAGFKSGAPGSWQWDGKKLTSIPPTGDAVVVKFAYRDATGQEIEAPATSWVVNADTGARFGTGATAGFVFAGSGFVKRQGREMYDADGSGLLIGLTTFGSESIAWREVISPESDAALPEWIADPKVVPAFGTPVIVRLNPSP